MNQIIIDGIAYYDADKEMTFYDAEKWAEEQNLRLLRRGEFLDVWDRNEEFRKLCDEKCWWTADRNWACNGHTGYPYDSYRDYENSVLCCIVFPKEEEKSEARQKEKG